ncbi:phosphatases II [Gonapodya prolifera JEL478]|uniref:Phosphatases II n=1 Tax=Gonapodya prolifera (strain JEL478) TaxID=1344416 RepID=A0A139AIQ2_GONPJ|nr:phosphatases II [Gonapodya prolifera JEL478]|eukprot:KXS16677.1 phosphatases II [Gonapodya prolifera JEL478]
MGSVDDPLPNNTQASSFEESPIDMSVSSTAREGTSLNAGTTSEPTKAPNANASETEQSSTTAMTGSSSAPSSRSPAALPNASPTVARSPPPHRHPTRHKSAAHAAPLPVLARSVSPKRTRTPSPEPAPAQAGPHQPTLSDFLPNPAHPAPRTSQSHPLNISWIFPEELIAVSPGGRVEDAHVMDHGRDLLDLVVSAMGPGTLDARVMHAMGVRRMDDFGGDVPGGREVWEHHSTEQEVLGQGLMFFPHAETSEGSESAPLKTSDGVLTHAPSEEVNDGATQSVHEATEDPSAASGSNSPSSNNDNFDSRRTTEKHISHSDSNFSLIPRRVYFAPPTARPQPTHPNSTSLPTLPQTSSHPSILANSYPPRRGNLCLSSCPGKKVRLATGPVRGRAAVCRDLGEDFTRLKERGVGLVVCLLDDAEMARLGAPWEQYREAAHGSGIDVARYPIVEGHAPPTYQTLNALLTLMLSHLQRGHHVLTHCRGGVGRAAVVACCLLIRLGVVNGGSSEERGRRAIAVVRARRGMRSVETKRQEEFVEGFWAWLVRVGDGTGGTPSAVRESKSTPSAGVQTENAEGGPSGNDFGASSFTDKGTSAGVL